ncbi:MAG: glycerol-3-phosphate 1-O-acyltransferase PlsY [Clostridia bacterium]|nr:glycerol-3-phosphate 1-O-acyltransferase PlsY [Clostridia bacterium]
MVYAVICTVFAYLLGSVSTAIIVSKKFFGYDVRNYGSGNAGATNILRNFGKKAGAIVFFLDFSKGLIAVAIARVFVAFFDASYECLLLAGFFAQFGHTFPLFFKFRGGKGVATAAGAALGIMPLVAVILLAAFAVIVLLTKTVSLASGICAAFYPLLAYFLSGVRSEYNFVFAVSCAVMIAVKHAPNIARLLDGEEKKISND